MNNNDDDKGKISKEQGRLDHGVVLPPCDDEDRFLFDAEDTWCQ